MSINNSKSLQNSGPTVSPQSNTQISELVIEVRWPGKHEKTNRVVVDIALDTTVEEALKMVRTALVHSPLPQHPQKNVTP